MPDKPTVEECLGTLEDFIEAVEARSRPREAKARAALSGLRDHIGASALFILTIEWLELREYAALGRRVVTLYKVKERRKGDKHLMSRFKWFANGVSDLVRDHLARRGRKEVKGKP